MVQFAQDWATSELRPRPEPEVLHAWDELLGTWLESDLPLFVRKDADRHRGVLRHEMGRELHLCDNSVAVWAFSLAIDGICPGLDGIAAELRAGSIPTALTRLGKYNQLYKAGWKLAHVTGVGLRTRLPVEQVAPEVLKEHHLRLVCPSNMFVIPKVWAGLGEIPEVIETVSKFDDIVRTASGYPIKRIHALPFPSSRGSNATVSYTATRLIFKAKVIEPLADDETFSIVTPGGEYRLTKRQFCAVFRNVATSASYREGGEYSYSNVPEKAKPFLVR